MFCPAEAQARLQTLGVERLFDMSRLAQLYYALDNSYSLRWFCLSDEDKQVIRADVVAILGRVPKLVTNETIAADAAKAAIAKARVKKKRKSKPCLPTPELEFIEDSRLRALLRTHAPRKPWCCDDFYQNAPRALGVALRKRYIQLNPPGFCSFIVADLDYANASEAWKDKIPS